ncbi:MAG TPA: 1-(5-phosphoribosyl)-5-[(5-phosphoribosylamino)methylideneamino]imidazole-4-carboxamide isomerase [Ktedonobacterales bacterium]
MITAMTLYPAIDLLGGHCVRLRQGDFAQARVFDGDPVDVARRWQEAGATWLHVVDLDGALAGQPKHLEVLRAIALATGLSIQTGGGLRTLDDVAAAFDAGAARVLLGTAAARDPHLLATALERWAERIAVSIDSRGGQVTVAGWLEMVSESAADFARRMAGGEVRTLVLTNVERDGTLAGADTSVLATLRAELPNTTLIAAGGIATVDDLRALARVGLDGAVLGRSLYEGTLNLPEALRTVQEGAKYQQEQQRKATMGGGGC